MATQKDRALYILDTLQQMYPDAHCELLHRNAFELLVAVSLSAQTTDAAVNRVTPLLFERFPNPQSFLQAGPAAIEPYIRTIGLFRNKAKNIWGMSKLLIDRFGGAVPRKREDLESLPGVGRKTANVVMAVAFSLPAIAVDTHVARVSKRLGLAKENADVLAIEKKLMSLFPQECWSRAHHQLLFFGRYFCKAQKPLCDECPFKEKCRYVQK